MRMASIMLPVSGAPGDVEGPCHVPWLVCGVIRAVPALYLRPGAFPIISRLCDPGRGTWLPGGLAPNHECIGGQGAFQLQSFAYSALHGGPNNPPLLIPEQSALPGVRIQCENPDPQPIFPGIVSTLACMALLCLLRIFRARPDASIWT